MATTNPVPGGPASLFGAVASTSFATTIPLNGNKYMPQQSVASVLTFSPGPNPAPFSQCKVRLVADGVNVPLFSGFLQYGDSAGYLNTNGVINDVTFWFDGYTSWYSVFQAASPTAVTAPTFSSAAIASGSPTTLTITMNQALNTLSVPPTSAFTIANSGGADTVTAVSVSGSTVVLTKSRTTISSDVITVSYTDPVSGKITALNGGLTAATFTAQSVTNGLVPPIVFVRFAGLTQMTESGNGTTGYNYTATAGFSSTSAHNPSVSLPANTDGWFETTIATIGATPQFDFIGLNTSSGSTLFPNPTYGMYSDNTPYKFVAGGSAGATNTATINAAQGDKMRLRRAGSTIYGEVSKDSGATWTIVQTWTGASNARLYPWAAGASTAPNVVGTPRAFGMT